MTSRRHFPPRRLVPLLSLGALAIAALGFAIPARAKGALAAEVARPVSLPDIAIGSAKAAVTITEYASMSCPHCAAWGENVFPMLRARYIDTGKVRFIFREFPLDIKAAAGSMLARCIGKDDSKKYFAVVETLFHSQNDWVMNNTTESLKRIGKQAGMSDQSFSECLANQPLLDALKATQDHAVEKLKVNSTPTFFVNGTMLKGGSSFEDFDKLIKPTLKS